MSNKMYVDRAYGWLLIIEHLSNPGQHNRYRCRLVDMNFILTGTE